VPGAKQETAATKDNHRIQEGESKATNMERWKKKIVGYGFEGGGGVMQKHNITRRGLLIYSGVTHAVNDTLVLLSRTKETSEAAPLKT